MSTINLLRSLSRLMQCYENFQYSQGNTLESGYTQLSWPNGLEEAVCIVFKEIEVLGRVIAWEKKKGPLWKLLTGKMPPSPPPNILRNKKSSSYWFWSWGIFLRVLKLSSTKVYVLLQRHFEYMQKLKEKKKKKKKVTPVSYD